MDARQSSCKLKSSTAYLSLVCVAARARHARTHSPILSIRFRMFIPLAKMCIAQFLLSLSKMWLFWNHLRGSSVLAIEVLGRNLHLSTTLSGLLLR